MITVLRFKAFKDVLHQIPKLSRTYSIFKDFSGPGKMSIFFKDFQELSRPCGHPGLNCEKLAFQRLEPDQKL